MLKFVKGFLYRQSYTVRKVYNNNGILHLGTKISLNLTINTDLKMLTKLNNYFKVNFDIRNSIVNFRYESETWKLS